MRRATRRGLVLGGVAALIFGATTRAGWIVLAPILLSVVDHSQPRTRCDDWIGQLAAVVHGRGVEYREQCAHDALSGARTEVLLERIARNPRRRSAARTAALRILADGHAEIVQVGADVLDEATEAPVFRRAALRAMAASRGGVVWIEEPRRWPAHGGFDTAALLLAAEGGDPGEAAAAWQVLGDDIGVAERAAALATLGVSEAELRAAVARTGAGQSPIGLPARWREVLDRTGCDADCDALIGALLLVEARQTPTVERPAAPTLPGDDGLLDVLYGPELGEHVRAEAAATLGWIAADSTVGAARALATAASVRADEQSVGELQRRAGDVHAALRHGGGTPGAVAAALELVGAGAGGATAWIDPEGVTVEIADHKVAVTGCAVPHEPRALPRAAIAVPRGGIGALTLVEAAGRALRDGEPGRALDLSSEAAQRWDAVPGLGAVRASATAARLASTLPDSRVRDGRDAASREPGADARGRRGWVHPDGLHVAIRVGTVLRPPPDLDIASRRAAGEVEVRALAPDARALTLAAWWAAAYGDIELARHLVPGPLAGPYEDVRVATLWLAEEPTAPVGPLSRVVAGLDAGEVGCPPAFSPWPTLPTPTPAR